VRGVRIATPSANLIAGTLPPWCQKWWLCGVDWRCCGARKCRPTNDTTDWCSEEDDRQVATCPQLGCTNRLKHVQFRPGTHSFPVKSATLAVQVFRCLHKMAPEYLSSVYLLPTRLRHLWPSPHAIGWPWSSWFPTCETCFVRRTFICIRRPFELELTSCLP